jgi:DNA-binding NarL/FixJ family response regulator
MRYLLAIISASLVTVSAFARLLPNKDPLNGVLDAELVVIVMQLPGERPGISMPGMSGIEVANELKRRGQEAKIVFLTVQEDLDILAACLAAGGLG